MGSGTQDGEERSRARAEPRNTKLRVPFEGPGWSSSSVAWGPSSTLVGRGTDTPSLSYPNTGQGE